MSKSAMQQSEDRLSVRPFHRSELFRYLVASGIAFIIDFSMLYVLTDYFGLYYLHASALSFVSGILSIYILSITWVFQHRSFSKKRIELPVFIVIGIIGLMINQTGMYLITETVGLYYLLSKILISILVFAWNFTARKIILFTKK